MSFVLVHESSVAVQKAAYLDNHTLCRIVVHSCRMQLLRAQFSAIVNTEPEEHTTEVKQELRGRIGDSPFGICNEHIRQPRDSDVVLSSTVPPCPPIAMPDVTMCLSRPWDGVLKLATQDSNRSPGRFCLYAVRGAKRCPIPSKFPLKPGARFRSGSVRRQ
jgi:hypothetical protein